MDKDYKLYLNLYDSPNISEINNYKFYFSTLYLKEKFDRIIDKYIQDHTLKLENQYKFKILNNEFLLISCYKNVEKRGFLVKRDNKEINSSTLILDF